MKGENSTKISNPGPVYIIQCNHSYHWLIYWSPIWIHITGQARRKEFLEGGSSTRTATRCYCGRSPGVFGAKSCNLAISRHFILTFGKSCFSKLIIKDFHQILDLISHSLNKTSTLIVLICFQGGGVIVICII